MRADRLATDFAGELDCDIPVVISNHPDLEHIARTFNIEFQHLPMKKARLLTLCENHGSASALPTVRAAKCLQQHL